MKFGKIAFIFTLSVITPVGLTASFVSEEFTCKIADNFFSQKGVAKGFISSTVNCQSGNQTVAYVHNFSQGGWVMVAADDAIEPIVAYNYDNTYALDTTDDIQASIFKGLSDRIKHLSKSSTRKSEKWSILSKKPYPSNTLRVASSTVSYRNLLVNDKRAAILWNQSTFYNSLCPVIDGKHCLTGCVPTAAGMIMYMWQWPERYPREDVDGDVAIEWDKMEGKLTDENQHVALLLASIGKHTEVEYGVDSTFGNISKVEQTLRDYGYLTIMEDPYVSSAEKAEAAQEELVTLIRSEIKQGRPVLFSGSSARTPSGHSFVVCGIDDEHEEYFYCNLGWGGRNNAFYNFSDRGNEDLPYLEKSRFIHHIMPIHSSNDKPVISNATSKTGPNGFFEAEVSNAQSYVFMAIKEFEVMDTLIINGNMYVNEVKRPKIILRKFGIVDESPSSIRIDCGSDLIDDATLYCFVAYDKNGQYTHKQCFFDGTECEIEEPDEWGFSAGSICQETLAQDWSYYELDIKSERTSVALRKEVGGNKFSIYSNAENNEFCVVSEEKDYDISILDMTGKNIANFRSLNGNKIFKLEHTVPGIYNVIISWNGKQQTHRIVKK